MNNIFTICQVLPKSNIWGKFLFALTNLFRFLIFLYYVYLGVEESIPSNELILTLPFSKVLTSYSSNLQAINEDLESAPSNIEDETQSRQNEFEGMSTHFS